MKKFILPLFAAALLASCENTVTDSAPDNIDGRIDLRPGIEAFTRSPHLNEDGSGTFTDGDVFSLTISSGGTYVEMKDYTMPSTPLHWEDLKLPEGTKEVSFSGCYPKHDEDMGSTFVFNINHAEGEEKDLLLAPAVKTNIGSASPIILPFGHAMHKLVVKYRSDDYTEEYLKTIQTTPHGAAECTIDLVTGSVFGLTTGTLENYGTQTGKEISVLLVPQAKNLVSLQVCIDGKTRIFKLSELPQTASEGQSIERLEGGKQLVVELTVNKSGITVSGISIQGWETQGSVSGSVTIG